MSLLNGVLPVDKPVGPTSHDIVALARRALGERRIGHTGTLDPFASGLLLLCLGPATRLAEYLTPLPKTYLATLLLGATTDTDDHTGRVLATSDAWRALAPAAIRAALGGQVGTLRQLPPAYSAKRVEGERAYEAARRGRSVRLEPAEVTVYRLDVLRLEPPEVEFEVVCSSGTYIRSLARDVGDALEVGAHLTALRRTGVGDFQVDDAVAAAALGDPGVRDRVVPPLQALAHLARVGVSEREAGMLAQGRAVPFAGALPEDTPIALASATGALLAIGIARDGAIRPRKVFA